MNYILKQFDEPLVKFSATTDTSEPEIQILWTNEEKSALLPLDLTLTPDGVSRWLRRRTIPKIDCGWWSGRCSEERKSYWNCKNKHGYWK